MFFSDLDELAQGWNQLTLTKPSFDRNAEVIYDKNKIILRFLVPGVDPTTIGLQVIKERSTVVVEVSYPKNRKYAYRIRENIYDVDNATASYKYGVLDVHIPLLTNTPESRMIKIDTK